jgi:hypothetical protein
MIACGLRLREHGFVSLQLKSLRSAKVRNSPKPLGLRPDCQISGCYTTGDLGYFLIQTGTAMLGPLPSGKPRPDDWKIMYHQGGTIVQDV